MQADRNVGKMTKCCNRIVARCLDYFLYDLVIESIQVAKQESGNAKAKFTRVTDEHLHTVISSKDEFECVRGISDCMVKEERQRRGAQEAIRNQNKPARVKKKPKKRASKQESKQE